MFLPGIEPGAFRYTTETVELTCKYSDQQHWSAARREELLRNISTGFELLILHNGNWYRILNAICDNCDYNNLIIDTNVRRSSSTILYDGNSHFYDTQ